MERQCNPYETGFDVLRQVSIVGPVKASIRTFSQEAHDYETILTKHQLSQPLISFIVPRWPAGAKVKPVAGAQCMQSDIMH
jgi:hypothetical protein